MGNQPFVGLVIILIDEVYQTDEIKQEEGETLLRFARMKCLSVTTIDAKNGTKLQEPYTMSTCRGTDV